MTIKRLGEVALRTANLDTMQYFYSEVIGLEPMNTEGDIRFLKIGEGYAGHTQVLVLFHEAIPPDNGNDEFTSVQRQYSTLHHIALAIDNADYESEKTRLEGLGYVVETAIHHWMKWRSLYISDPDGNTVELVCYDETIDTS